MSPNLIFNLFIVAIFGCYTVGTLWIADTLLSSYLPGYVFSGNYVLGLCIFVVVGFAYVSLAQWRMWYDWRNYMFAAVAVFFPLVFIASAISISIQPLNNMTGSFTELYCAEESFYQVCGKAFAAVVSSMSLRALPAVLTVPILFYSLVVRRRIS